LPVSLSVINDDCLASAKSRVVRLPARSNQGVTLFGSLGQETTGFVGKAGRIPPTEQSRIRSGAAGKLPARGFAMPREPCSGPFGVFATAVALFASAATRTAQKRIEIEAHNRIAGMAPAL
jgi:hypothetical protein